MELGVCMLIQGQSATFASRVDFRFHNWMLCLMSYMSPSSFLKLTWGVTITKLGWKKKMSGSPLMY